MGTWELCSLQQNMPLPHQTTLHHSSIHSSPALLPSSHPTAPDPKLQQLNTNSSPFTAHAQYNLRLPNVSKQASEADILPSFKHSLISVGQLCDDDCTATFSKHWCMMYNKHNKPVITGIRNPQTSLYEQQIPVHHK